MSRTKPADPSHRLNAALREVGKLSALVDELRNELGETKAELAKTRSNAASHRPPTADVDTDQRIRALSFQLLQERKQHEATLERMTNEIERRSEQWKDSRSSAENASSNLRYLHSTTLRACDEAEEYMDTLMTALASMGVLTMIPVQSSLDGLSSVIDRLRKRSNDNVAAAVGDVTSATAASSAVAQPRLDVISAEAHIRREKGRVSQPVVRKRSRPVSAAPAARRASPRASGSVTTGKPRPSSDPLDAIHGADAGFLKSVCGDLTKENHRLRLEIQSLTEAAQQSQQAMAKLQRQLDGAKATEYAVNACREHASLLETRLLQQDAQLASDQQVIAHLQMELQQLTRHRDEALHRLDFALKRNTLPSTWGLSIPISTSSSIPLYTHEKAQKAQTTGVRRTSVASSVSTRSKASSTNQQKSSKAVSKPRPSGLSRFPVSAARAPTPGSRGKASPSTLSTTSNSDSTATAEFIRTIHNIGSASKFAPAASPTIMREIVRDVLQTSIQNVTAAPEGVETTLTPREEVEKSERASFMPSENVRSRSIVSRHMPEERTRLAAAESKSSNILNQLRTMDAELETLRKKSLELHQQAQPRFRHRTNSSTISSISSDASSQSSPHKQTIRQQQHQQRSEAPAQPIAAGKKFLDMSWISEASES